MRKLAIDFRVTESEKNVCTIILQPIGLLAFKVRKLRRSRRIEPQPIIRDSYENKAEFEDAGDEEEDEEEEEEMTRQRQIYETAFDCKVSRSDDDLDKFDRMTNHPLIISQFQSGSIAPLSRASSSTESSQQSQHMLLPSKHSHLSSKEHRRTAFVHRPKSLIPSHSNYQTNQPTRNKMAPQQQPQPDVLFSLAQNMESLQMNAHNERNVSSCRGYIRSPPSTAPLPIKFLGGRRHEHSLLNMRSAPNLPSQNLPQQKDLYLLACDPSLHAKEAMSSPDISKGNVLELIGRPKSFDYESQKLIFEFKGRPEMQNDYPSLNRTLSLVHEQQISLLKEFKGNPREAELVPEVARSRREQHSSLLEFKPHTSQRRASYSSTESMTSSCSSSGGSMESLRSSTSEGNCSTSSTESRRSSSLSSHSSDNGGTNCIEKFQRQQQQHPVNNSSKLHILSPISDKSSQEPASETLDNNRNNNSQKASPEEAQSMTEHAVGTLTDSSFKKRRVPQNKNLISLALQSSSSGDTEVQGSDSGISIESKKLDNEQEFSDLPFDMPKLRRRRLLVLQQQHHQQDATTSGSATSMDLKDLPFDMPKLKRRLKYMQSTSSNTLQAFSNQSIKDTEPSTKFGSELMRSNMTLNLGSSNEMIGNENRASALALKKPSALHLELSQELNSSKNTADLVDVNLPLERQGWYHGSITRIEAEAILRLLREGSYLVRNSESTKQDYSLSLKSARGFMHMRIQQNQDLKEYTLGQFSKPFNSIPDMVRHFSINRLPIRGAEHMCLLHPVVAQLL